MARILRNAYQHLDIPDIGLAEFVLQEADGKYADKIALVDGPSGNSITYAQLKHSVKCVASGLTRLGLKKGQVLCIVGQNSVEWVQCFLGVLSTGAIVTAVNPAYTADEILYQLKDSSSVMVATSPELLPNVKEAAEKCGHISDIIIFGEAPGCVSFSTLLADDGSAAPQGIQYDTKNDVACLPYSSGTTGLPKGVMLSHHNIVANLIQSSHPSMLEERDDVVSLALLPFYHCYGMIVIAAAGLFKGSKIVTLPAFEPSLFLRTIQDYKISMLFLVPPLVVFLAKSPMVNDYDMSSVKFMGSGAAPLAAEVQDETESRFTLDYSLRQGYGLTETGPVIVQAPLEGYVSGSVGKVIPMTECKVIDVETGQLLGPEQDGELCFRGPQIMLGYLNKPQSTASCIDIEGWFHTGDVGHYDEKENLYIVDRIKELIKYKGLQVAPAELEGFLLTHPAVADVAVVGIPDLQAGELPRAYVVLKQDHTLTEQDVKKFVEDNKAPHKRLRGGVEFVSMIPKTPSGKILRRDIREAYKKKMGGQSKL